MVVAIAKVGPRVVAYERGLLAAEGMEDVASGPEGTAEGHQVVPHIVDPHE